jgi:hypothetical protein
MNADAEDCSPAPASRLHTTPCLTSPYARGNVGCPAVSKVTPHQEEWGTGCRVARWGMLFVPRRHAPDNCRTTSTNGDRQILDFAQGHRYSNRSVTGTPRALARRLRTASEGFLRTPVSNCAT